MTTRDKLIFAIFGIIIELAILVHITFASERFTLLGAIGDSVTVRWAANTEPDLAGYRLYYVGPGQDGEKHIAAPDTSLRLRVKLTYFWELVRFRLTAVDRTGNESAPSDTITTIMCKEPRLVGDIDGNGRVNVLDKALYWLSAGTKRGDLRYSERADIDGNGRVDVMDKGLMQLNSGAKR